MHADNTSDTQRPLLAFLRGFLLRLFCGILGLLMLALATPRLFGEGGGIAVVMTFYLIICIGGGAHDIAHTTEGRKFRLSYSQLFLCIAISLGCLTVWWLGR